MITFSDVLILSIVIMTIYLSDCIIFIKDTKLVFRSLSVHNWNLISMKNLFNTKFGGISLLNPLPPLGSYFSCEVVPLSISPDFIMCSNIHNFTMSLYDVNCLYLIKVDNVSAVTSSENRLLINGQIVCCIDNTCLLNSLVSLISSIAQLPLEEREVKIKTFWQMRMDLNTASETILNANSIQSRLRIYCNFLFVLITIAVPLIYLFPLVSG